MIEPYCQPVMKVEKYTTLNFICDTQKPQTEAHGYRAEKSEPIGLDSQNLIANSLSTNNKLQEGY